WVRGPISEVRSITNLWTGGNRHNLTINRKLDARRVQNRGSLIVGSEGERIKVRTYGRQKENIGSVACCAESNQSGFLRSFAKNDGMSPQSTPALLAILPRASVAVTDRHTQSEL